MLTAFSVVTVWFGAMKIAPAPSTKNVMLSAAKDLLFYGRESRSFALLRMTAI
jgi:hypothetical protein